MKVLKGPGIQYTVTNTKVSLSISSTTGNTYKTLVINQISQTIIISNSQVVKEKLRSEKSCNVIVRYLFYP